MSDEAELARKFSVDMSRAQADFSSGAAPSAASGVAKGTGGHGASRFDSSFDALAKNFSIEPKGDDKEVRTPPRFSAPGNHCMHAP